MAERKSTSLLDFAIAASIAVVPVLLGVVLLVAVIRPADADASGRVTPERYMSARQVAALKTFEPAVLKRSAIAEKLPDSAGVLTALPACGREWRGASPWRAWLAEAGLARTPPPAPAEQVAAQLAAFDAALLAFSSRANPRVEHPVGLDVARWFSTASAALATPIANADAPGHPFRLRCADLADALAALSRGDAAMLESVAWRGSESRVALARWPEAQEMLIPARQVMRRNPWSGVGGCIYFGAEAAGEGGVRPFLAAAKSAQRRICTLPELAGASGAASAPANAGGVSATAVATVLAGEPGLADPLDDSRWSVPPSLQAMLQPLESLRQPTGALYRLQTGGAPTALDGDDARAAQNRIVIDGTGVDVGFSIDLSIDPALQALAQKTAACYTGRQDACRALGLHRQGDKAQPLGEPLLEGAMVRMAAVAVIDVASGRIEALAGALSPCARQEVDGPGRDKACDSRLPYPVQYRPDALLNPAVFHDAMPASTVKPIMAAAFLSDPEVGARWLAAEQAAMKRDGVPARESLRGQLMRSDSARFLDRMFCSEKSFADCRRPWQVQAAASAFGWNAGCVDARSDCGKRDLLFGGTLGSGGNGTAALSDLLATPVAYGRLMSEPLAGKAGAAMHLMPPMALDAGIVRRCAAGADTRRMSDDDWEKCRGGAVVDTVAEGWGQGHARASALGIAGMMATLAAAANGQREVAPPHLVDAVRRVAAGGAALGAEAGPWRPVPAVAHGLSPQAASVILSGLSYSHRAGTARTACEQVFDPRRCRDIDWLAGKTGTPSFPSDGISLDELARLCPKGAEATLAAQRGACSSLRPYKWYVAVWRDPASPGPWTKAIAVLTERNWLRQTGQVHGAGDHGPNPSAEIAMQIAGRRVGLLSGAAPGEPAAPPPGQLAVRSTKAFP